MYALKTLEKGNISEESLKMVRQEISIMALLDHPNILRLHESFETANKIFLVMPLCRGKELLERLNKQSTGKYNESVACKYMKT
jgi:serine/threonine protein kinase